MGIAAEKILKWFSVENCPLILKVILLFSSCNLIGQSNLDFEQTSPGQYSLTNSVNGWTVSSTTLTGCSTPTNFSSGSPEFSLLSTPLVDPVVGTISNSPLGGSVIASVQNYTPSSLQT